jgi:putative ribosome biogenesis GTPase RsgA
LPSHCVTRLSSCSHTVARKSKHLANSFAFNRDQDKLTRLEKELDELQHANPSAASTLSKLYAAVKTIRDYLKKGLGCRITLAGRNGVGKSWILVRTLTRLMY